MCEVKIGRWEMKGERNNHLYRYQIPVRHMVPSILHEVVHKVMIDDVDDITSRGMTLHASFPGPARFVYAASIDLHENKHLDMCYLIWQLKVHVQYSLSGVIMQ
jgi:hypothetical protein